MTHSFAVFGLVACCFGFGLGFIIYLIALVTSQVKENTIKNSTIFAMSFLIIGDTFFLMAICHKLGILF